ncbi:uncharacterized protein LOC113563066 [Ooceraea biroi]|nr:uncharacterized protein LOC113563066 [Ooceraea biroi]
MRFNDAREPVVCRKTTESLATNEIHHDESVKHVRPTMSKYRTQETQQNQQTLYSDQTFLQKEQDNMSTCDTSEPQNDVINKVYKSFNDKSCSIKLKKVQSASTLKIIVRKMCLENVPNPLKPIVIRLRLPCKPSDLIQCIFEIDPFLDESCLMRRKFQVSMYNVCSCLNDSLGKLGVKVTKSKLRLDCNIRPGYISFKLKADGASNADRHFFVARVPICQNVCQYTIQQDSAVSSRDSKLNIKTSVIRDKFNDTRMDEESDELNNTCCPCLDQSFVENLVLNTSQDKRENEEETICITDKVPKCFNDFTISSCDKVCENITKEISNVALHTDKLEEGNEEHCKILDSIEIKCHDGMETCKKNFHLSNLIVESEFIQSANDANYTYLSYDISIEANKDIINISSKNLKNSSHTTNVDEYKRVCPSDKESKEGNKYNDIDTCSITSFVQNSDRDKQLVELNYNRFLQNDTKMINEQSRTKDNSLLNSIKAETECECSNCPRQHDDFINITAIDNISRESIVYVFDAFRDDLNAIETRSTSYLDTMKTSSKNNLLTVFDQMPRLIISSKGINVDISYQSAVWLAFDNDTDVSITTKKCDNCKEVTDSSTRNLTVPKRENKNFYDDIDIEKRSGRMQRSVKSFDRPFISKKKFRSSKEFKRSDISTNECLRANNSSTYVTSEASCSSRLIAITSDFTTSENRDKFQKSCKLRKSCGYGCFDNSITSIKYETTAQYQDDYFADVRPRTTFMMTKFRNSVHKSVNRIKRLIRAKLFNKKAGMTLILKNKFWKNMGFFKDTKQETRKYIRQVHFSTDMFFYKY